MPFIEDTNDLVILRNSGAWQVYSSPVAIITASDSSEVAQCFKEIDRVLSKGYYAAGFVSYDAAAGIDRAMRVKTSNSSCPLVWFGVYEKYEHLAELPVSDNRDFHLSSCCKTINRDHYNTAINQVHQHLAAGNTYQVNFTYKRKYRFVGDPYSFFLELYSMQPTDCAAFIRTAEFSVCSVSPELFFEMEDGNVVVKPMKGTRAVRAGSDIACLKDELVASEKDRSENVMIVDMIRNDLGRVAEAGSVEVPEMFCIEQHRTVLQMTSTVTARAKSGPVEVMQSLFPCASITGAPKVASMEIISVLEEEGRGLYTGAIGYFAPDKSARLNVAIRTAVLDNNTGVLDYGVGGGIVWDSLADSEYQESLDKAEVIEQVRSNYSLFETIHFSGRRFRFINEHFARIEKSVSELGINFSREKAVSLLNGFALEFSGQVRRVKLLLSPVGELSVESAAFNKGARREWTVALSGVNVNSKNPYLHHKTTKRQIYDLCKASASEGVDDVLLYNESGNITESTIANVLYRLGGKWYTPPLTDGLLAGTARAALIRRGHLQERSLPVNRLAEVEDLFLINSLRGLIRCRLVGGE